MSSDSGPRTKTQSDLLPTEIKAMEIDTLDEKDILEKDTDFPGWKTMVYCTLLPRRCHDLVQSDIPRPKPEDPRHVVGDYYSTVVGVWLCSQVSDSIKTDLVHARTRDDDDFYADVVMERIEKIVLGNGRVQTIFFKLNTFWSTKRNQYDSAIDFINDFNAQVELLHYLEVPIPWVVALARILQQLEDELPGVQFMKCKIDHMLPEEITEEKFFELCASIRYEARHEATR